ncbi:uncharacterized protein LOC129912490 [Episyrphus balteatus]|uniref:uncharacterized protein LOC129912490 n=1 Tax=Episyrphus balteatus TaxID=286459 RepID=UPI0024863A53|nr:uncharacterized protein LOC129912490 [Episyrphus balteatus]
MRNMVKNFSSNIPKQKTRKIWMKKRSKHWWNTIVKSETFDDQMVENFRMDKQSFQFLCEKLSPALSPSAIVVREAIPVDMKVGIALYKLASCAEYRVVGNQFGVHKSTVKKCVYEFCRAVVDVLLKDEIHLPDESECLSIIRGFEEKSGVPQILGAIDGTHVPIRPPLDGGADYINRKGWPSMVLQAVVDCNYLFMDITCKHPGSVHDATVLKDSYLSINIDKFKFPKATINGVEMSAFFIGDPAYPQLPWLIKGYTGTLDPVEDSFNAYLNRARIVVENAFGRLKGRWRILQKRIDIDVKFVPHIVATCCVLHNILERRRSPYRETWNTDTSTMSDLLTQPASTNITSTLQGDEIRNHLKLYMAQNFPLIRSIKSNV